MSKDVEELAEMMNPTIKGWISYYGKFYKTALKSVFSYLNACLMRWAEEKYKRLTGKTRASKWFEKTWKAKPGLFIHWAEGFTGWCL